MNLIKFFGDEASSTNSVYWWYGEFTWGRSSLQDEFRFVMVDQNQLLFRKPLMLCTNCYCKIVMWPIVRLRQPQALVGPAYIQYCMNIWLSKKFVRNGSHTICQLLKIWLKSIGRKKCYKNTIAVQKFIDLNACESV